MRSSADSGNRNLYRLNGERKSLLMPDGWNPSAGFDERDGGRKLSDKIWHVCECVCACVSRY